MHPNERIAHSYRQLIKDGALSPGERLPSVDAIAAAEGVSSTTVRHAFSWLAAEGYIRSTPRGTVVCDRPEGAPTARERMIRGRETGSQLARGETLQVHEAGLVKPPGYVASLFGTPAEGRLVRRQYRVAWNDA